MKKQTSNLLGFIVLLFIGLACSTGSNLNQRTTSSPIGSAAMQPSPQTAELLIKSPARTILGKVVAVADGDMITVFDENKKQWKIRIGGIDMSTKENLIEKTKQINNFVSSEKLYLMKAI